MPISCQPTSEIVKRSHSWACVRHGAALYQVRTGPLLLPLSLSFACFVAAVGVAMIPGLRKRGIIQQVMKQAGDTVSGLRAGKDKSTWGRSCCGSWRQHRLIDVCVFVIVSDQPDISSRIDCKCFCVRSTHTGFSENTWSATYNCCASEACC